jgi:ribose 5-phosphate isomerase B
MKVAVGADHKGFEFKQKVKEILRKLGHEVIDFGTNSTEPVDYPDFGLKVAHAVVNGEADYGITVCWTGNGMNIAVNKVKGIRAGLALNPEMAYLTRLHNDANVLTLSSKFTPNNQLEQILKAFLETKYEGGRHVARLEKIREAEKGLFSG